MLIFAISSINTLSLINVLMVIKCLLNEFVKFVYRIVWIADSFKLEQQYFVYVRKAYSFLSRALVLVRQWLLTCAVELLHEKLTRNFISER